MNKKFSVQRVNEFRKLFVWENLQISDGMQHDNLKSMACIFIPLQKGNDNLDWRVRTLWCDNFIHVGVEFKGQT